MDSSSVRVLWLGSPQGGEGTWLKNVLLKRVGAHEVTREEYLAAPEAQTLVVFTGLQREPNLEVLRVLKRNKNVALLILSDEKLRHSVRRYRQASLILRNYFSPFLAWRKRIFTVPLGYLAGYESGPHVRAPNDRLVPWAFFGQVKNNDRSNMLKAFDEVRWAKGDPELHVTRKWKDEDALSASACAERLGRTVFTPCPRGNMNPDTFRVMEALESGSIPVITTFYGVDYFRYTFGDHPFVVAESWDQAARECGRLLGEPVELESRLNEVAEWYAHFVSELQHDVEKLVRGQDRKNLSSRQFESQRRARLSIRANMIFFKHFRFSVGRRKVLGLFDRAFRW